MAKAVGPSRSKRLALASSVKITPLSELCLALSFCLSVSSLPLFLPWWPLPASFHPPFLPALDFRLALGLSSWGHSCFSLISFPVGNLNANVPCLTCPRPDWCHWPRDGGAEATGPPPPPTSQPDVGPSPCQPWEPLMVQKGAFTRSPHASSSPAGPELPAGGARTHHLTPFHALAVLSLILKVQYARR